MKTVTLTVRIPPEVKERLEALAKATDRTQAYLASQAIEEFIQTQEWQIQAIEAGLEAADRGVFASDEEIEQAFLRWGVNVEH